MTHYLPLSYSKRRQFFLCRKGREGYLGKKVDFFGELRYNLLSVFMFICIFNLNLFGGNGV